MKKKITTLLASIALVTSSIHVNADIGSEVNKWFSDQGYANVTKPQEIDAQAGRMYTLGGIQTRNQVKSGFNFVNIQPPRVSAGCSGIDIYAGGFGFVNEEQFIQSLKAIGQNAKSLAFMMAIKIASAQLEDEIAKIQDWANKFNQFQIDSCSAASELLEIGTRQVGFTEGCVQLRMQQKGEERYEAEYACTTGGKASQTMSNKDNPEMNQVVFTQGNLAWSVLMQDSYFKNNPELAEIMMNIMGTVIVDSTAQGSDAQPKVTYSLPSALGQGYTTEKFKSLFDYFYLGKDSKQRVTYYACDVRTSDQQACQALSEVSVRPQHEGMKTKIDKVLFSITQKVRDGGQDLSNEEKGVIVNSSLPILAYINSATASSKFLNSNMTANVNVGEDFSSIIAYDLVINNLKSLIERAKINAHNNQKGLSESKDFVDYQKQLEGVLSEISKLERENIDRGETTMKMYDQIKTYEKEILNKVSPHYINAAEYR